MMSWLLSFKILQGASSRSIRSRALWLNHGTSLLPGRETTVGQHGLSPERQDWKGMQAATGLPITFRFRCSASGSGPSSEAMKIQHPHEVNSYPCLFCQLWYQEQCGCCGGRLGLGSCDHGRDPSSQLVVSLGTGGVGLCFLLSFSLSLKHRVHPSLGHILYETLFLLRFVAGVLVPLLDNGYPEHPP